MSNGGFFDVSEEDIAKHEAWEIEQKKARQPVPEGWYEVMLSPFIVNGSEDKSIHYTTDKVTKEPNGGIMVTMWACIVGGDYANRKVKVSRWIKAPVGHPQEGWAVHQKKELADLYMMLNDAPYASANLDLSGFYNSLIYAQVKHEKEIDFKTKEEIFVGKVIAFAKEPPTAVKENTSSLFD